ncbi:MAG: ATP-binding protein [Bacteroidales bacterium]
MKHFRYRIGWIIFLFFPLTVTSQLPAWNYDSLFNVINTSHDQTEVYQAYALYSIKYMQSNTDSVLFYLEKASPVVKTDNLAAIADYYNGTGALLNQIKNSDSAIYWFRKAYKLSSENKIERIWANSAISIGVYNKLKGELDSALSYLNEAIQISEKNNLIGSSNKAHFDIGAVYSMLGRSEIALEHQFIALKQQEMAKDSFRMTYSFIGIGNTYKSLNKPDKAKAFYFMASRYDNLLKNLDLRNVILSNLGLIYENGYRNLDSALYYYKSAFKLIPENENSFSKIVMLINFGNVYYAKKDFVKSLEYYDKAIALNLQNSNLYAYSAVLINRGLVYLELKKFDSTYKLLDEGLRIAESIGAIDWQVNAQKGLFVADSSNKNYLEAISHLKILHTLKDSVYNENNLNRISELEIIYESRKKDALNQSLIERNRLDQKVIQNQRIIILWSIIAVILFILLVFNILRSIRKQKIINQKLHIVNNDILHKNREIDEKNQLLEEKTEQLTRINQTKDKLFSVISHDLRGPFNILQGYLDLMNMQDAHLTEEEKTEILRSIKISSENAYNLLINLLEWARSQRGLLMNKAEVIDIKEVIENTHSILQNRLESKNQSLVVDADPGIYVIADHNLLSSVLQNLIGNAIKFSSHESTIAIRCRKDEARLTVQILDQGIGIPKEDLYEIFVIGNNIKRKGTDNEPGTGLGLVLVEEFVKLMGGQIWVESEVGKGSVFSFTLPLFRTKK